MELVITAIPIQTRMTLLTQTVIHSLMLTMHFHKMKHSGSTPMVMVMETIQVATIQMLLLTFRVSGMIPMAMVMATIGAMALGTKVECQNGLASSSKVH